MSSFLGGVPKIRSLLATNSICGLAIFTQSEKQTYEPKAFLYNKILGINKSLCVCAFCFSMVEQKDFTAV